MGCTHYEQNKGLRRWLASSNLIFPILDWAKSATQGYALGDTIRNRNLQVDAGGLAAKGNITGARNTLYKGGDFAGAGQIDDRYRA
jgi:hypothetical protein